MADESPVNMPRGGDIAEGSGLLGNGRGSACDGQDR